MISINSVIERTNKRHEKRYGLSAIIGRPFSINVVECLIYIQDELCRIMPRQFKPVRPDLAHATILRGKSLPHPRAKSLKSALETQLPDISTINLVWSTTHIRIGEDGAFRWSLDIKNEEIYEPTLNQIGSDIMRKTNYNISYQHKPWITIGNIESVNIDDENIVKHINSNGLESCRYPKIFGNDGIKFVHYHDRDLKKAFTKFEKY